MKRRMICLCTVFFLLLTALMIRLAYIQFADGSMYRNIIAGQSRSNIEGIWVRGTIYDRNSIPLTNGENNYYFLFRKDKIDNDLESMLTEMDARLIEGTGDKYQIYCVDTIDRSESKKLCRDYGSLAVKSWRRYSKNQPAVHMIGHLNSIDHSGLCGIEKDFEEVLSSGRRAFTFQNDGLGYFVSGKGIDMDGGGREWGVFTTIDINIQREAEKALADNGDRGIAIVTYIPDGEILASACAPTYDPYDVSDFDKESGIISNNAIGSLYSAGSLYETVASIASEVYYNYQKKNKTDTVLEMVEAMGLNSRAVQLLSGQTVNNHTAFDEDLLISPMQAARMTRIIALEGRDCELRLIRGTIEGVRGASLLPKSVERQVISVDTAKTFEKMMQKQRTYEEGDEPNDICFETENSDSGYWISGYLPADDPVYGITVYVEGQDSDVVIVNYTDGNIDTDLSAKALANSIYSSISRFLMERAN